MERMNKEELINLVESLGIDFEEFWLLSSSALVMRDLFPSAGDLDIAVTEKGLEELKSKYEIINTHDNWYKVTDNIECVLDTKDDYKVVKYGKYNLQSLEAYRDWLLTSDREKDKERLEIVEKALGK